MAGRRRRDHDGGISTARLQANLDLLARETDALTRSLSPLGDEDMHAATLCAGWTRGHVVTHLARNAEALGNLLHWATTGERTEAYGSPQERAAAIDAGAGRSAEELRHDHWRTSEDFARRTVALHGPAGEAQVLTRTGTRVRGAQVPSMRLVEVVFHHADLQLGYTFADADPGFVNRALRRAVRGLERATHPPALTLTTTEGEEWVLGEGTHGVHGSRADLLLWLARGVDSGLTHDAPLPTPPPWG